MFGAEYFFPKTSDTAEQKRDKSARINSALLGCDGVTEITGTDPVRPAFDVSAFISIRATADTVIATLESVDPVTGEFVSDTAVSLASGAIILGFFTGVTLTSGSVVCNNIARQATSPKAELLAADVQEDGTVLLTLRNSASACNGLLVEVWRKANETAYTQSNIVAYASESQVILDEGPGDPSDVIKYKVRYAEPYEAGVSVGRTTEFSGEETVTLPDAP